MAADIAVVGLRMSETPVVWLTGANRGADTETCEKLTRSLVLTAEIMARDHGWPIVLDSLFSGYLSLAMAKVGPDHLSALLKKAQKDVPRFAAVVRAQGAKPEGSA